MATYTLYFKRTVVEVGELQVQAKSHAEAKTKGLQVYADANDDDVLDWDPTKSKIQGEVRLVSVLREAEPGPR